ncbi:MAG: acyltransferase [Lachnospiraceae bacterium]|nr:acyltransferase [Lachnospiraceae bacterium]
MIGQKLQKDMSIIFQKIRQERMSVNMLREIANQIRVRLCRIQFITKNILYGENFSPMGRINLRGSNIVIGNNVIIRSGMKFNAVGAETPTTLVVHGKGSIVIGNNVGISNSIFISNNEIILEDNVMIGGGCKLFDNDFHSINFQERMEVPDVHVKSLPITIKNGAFIGAYSIILKGVTVGERSIVAAGSVVSKDIPPNEIWGGAPAKFIRKLEN